MSSLEIFNQLDNQFMLETPNGTQNILSSIFSFEMLFYIIYKTGTKTVLFWAPYVIDQLSLGLKDIISTVRYFTSAHEPHRCCSD